MGRVVELRAGAREPQVGDRLAFDGGGWVPEVNIARPHGVTHVHTETVVHVVMGPWRSPDFVTGVSGWQIDADGSAEFNDITARGTITATAGEIGGWTIEAGHLYAGSGAARVGLKPGTYPFYAGAEAEASAPFRVNTGGEMWATNAHIEGEINANSGHLGTLDIDGVLTVGTGTPVIQIDGPNKRIRTSDFVSGQKGWEITHEGNAEFNNLFVRGELHATMFVADEMHATGGTLAVMTASKVADPINTGDNTLPNVGQPLMLVVQASWDTGLCYVADNHVLRIKSMAEVAAGGSLDLWDIWLEVDGTPTSNGDRDLANGKPGTYDCLCRLRQGGENGLVIPTGAAAVHWGTIGTEEGGLVLTSDLNYSPYMDIFTIPSATPWSSGTTPHVRVGNLDGVLSLGEEWGMAAGKDLSDATEPHIVMSDQRVRMWGVAQRWWDTSGNLRGEVDPSAGSSDVLFWLGPSEAGAHFKVLGSGDVWLDTLTISDDLGDFLFSKADGLLLLGPNCEINATGWWSLRRQKATITGAFHQEAGRWLGARGLVVEKGGTNLVINPSCETNVTGYAGNLVTVSQSTTEARFGTHSCKVVTTGASAYFAYQSGGTGYTAVTSNTVYTYSIWIFATSAGDAINFHWWEYDAGSGFLGSATTSQAYTLNSGWQKLTVTSTTRATCTKIRPVIQNFDNARTYYLDGMNVVQAGFVTTHIDGSLGSGYTWSGTAHASTSTRAATEVSLDIHTATLINNNATMSFRIVAQMPYDADGTWPQTDSYIMYAKYGSDYLTVRYNSTTDKFEAYIHDGWIIASAVQTFDAGDWIDLVLTLDFDNDVYTLYLNGEVADTDTTSKTPPVISTWSLGSDVTGGRQAGCTFAEFAVFDKVVSSSEVSAMYTLQRPLVDAGAMDSPGIYILDGKFRMASSLTGNRIEIDAEEIAGYNSGGTKQFYLRASDGAAMAGGGALIMDADGMRLIGTGLVDDPRRILFQDNTSGARTLGWVGAGWGGGGSDPNITWLVATRDSGDPWPATTQVNIAAVDTVVGTDVRVAVNSNKTVEVYGEDIFKTEKLLRPGTGTSDPTAKLEDGCLFYRTDTDKLRLRANGAWVNLN